MKGHILVMLLVTFIILINSIETNAKKGRSKNKPFWKIWFKKHRRTHRYSDESDSKSGSSDSNTSSASGSSTTELLDKNAGKPPGPVDVTGVMPQSRDMPFAIKALMSFISKAGCSNVQGYRKFMAHYKDANDAGQFKGKAADDPILLEMSEIAAKENADIIQRCPKPERPTCSY